MQLQGMTICFLGDSITQGVNTSAPEKVYHQLIEKAYGLKRAYNYGLRGTRIAPQRTPALYTWTQDLYFGLRAQIMTTKADAVVVFGGTNDYGHGDAPFGTVEDTDPSTFCGAVRGLILQLKAMYPEKPMLFLTPLNRIDVVAPKKSGKVLKDYAEAIGAICRMEQVAVLDLFSLNPIDLNDPEIVPDGLHPNDKGHEILAKVIGEALLNL